MDSLLPLLTFVAGLLLGLGVMFFARRLMSDHFRALSSEALNSSQDQFLKLAAERFKTLQVEHQGDLDKRTVAINEIIKPVDVKLQALNMAIAQISGTDKSLAEQIAGLQRETARIAGALNNPRERGRSAEILLERLFEHAGLVRGVNFRTQVTVGDVRPDFIIELKEQLCIVVDTKAPLIDVMNDLENTQQLQETAVKLAQQVRSHIKSLSAKKYNDIQGSVDFTVLFLPGDGLYAMAVDADRDLIDFAARHNIVLSSPMLLFGLVRMVHTLGRLQSLNQNAEEIRDLGAELHKRLTTFMDYFYKIGASMQVSFKHFNKAVSSFEARVLPQTRRFEELQGTPGHERIEAPARLEIISDDGDLDEKAA